MDMHDGEDVVAHTMIVDQVDGADDAVVRPLPHFFDQLVVESPKKAAVNCHTDTAEIAHWYSQISETSFGRHRFRTMRPLVVLGTLDTVGIPSVGLMVREAGREREGPLIPNPHCDGHGMRAAMINSPNVGTN